LIHQKLDKGSEQVLDDKIIQGLDFQKLSKAFPALESQLMAFKSRLVDAEFDFEQLKVWEVSGKPPCQFFVTGFLGPYSLASCFFRFLMLTQFWP
jgi:hypothetical protein